MSLTVQLYTMLIMTTMGGYLGVAIDTYNRFSMKRRSFHWFVACNDLLFWLIQGLVVFYVLLQTNNGEIRFYIFLALLCGYATYQALFRSVYQNILERIIQLYRLIIRGIYYVVVKPIKFILKIVYSFCMMVVLGILAIIMFILRVIWKVVLWVLFFLLKWTGLHRLVKKATPSLCKIKEIMNSVWKKKE